MSLWDHILTVEALVDAAKEEFTHSRGGSPFSVSEVDCVRGHFGNAWSAELYASDPEAVRGFVFSCALLVALVRGHCLVDGNKRLAWLGFTMGLAALGHDVDATTEDVEQLCLRIIEERLERQGVAAWVGPRLVDARL